MKEQGVMVNFDIDETSMEYRFVYNPEENLSLMLIYEIVSEIFDCVELASSIISDIKGVLRIAPTQEDCIIERIERRESEPHEAEYNFVYYVKTRDEEGKRILNNLLREICDVRKVKVIEG